MSSEFQLADDFFMHFGNDNTELNEIDQWIFESTHGANEEYKNVHCCTFTYTHDVAFEGYVDDDDQPAYNELDLASLLPLNYNGHDVYQGNENVEQNPVDDPPSEVDTFVSIPIEHCITVLSCDDCNLANLLASENGKYTEYAIDENSFQCLADDEDHTSENGFASCQCGCLHQLDEFKSYEEEVKRRKERDF